MMKNYRLVLGLLLSVLSSAWLIYLVRLPLMGNIGVPNRSNSRGGVAIAAILFCVGIILILRDAFVRNPRLEKMAEEEKILRDEIFTILPESGMSQAELNVYINNTKGKTGISALNAIELNALKVFIERRIVECGEAKDSDTDITFDDNGVRNV